MGIRGSAASQTSDYFNELAANDLGIDEWLAIRVGLACARAPDKVRSRIARLRGEGESLIPNRWPIAKQATDHLRHDLTTFILAYGRQMPRQAFLPMLEAGIALGLTNVLLSTTGCLFQWDQSGSVPRKQSPWPLFVDCSMGQDVRLRQASEAVMVECAARYEKLPVLMMSLRILDERARTDRELRNILPNPYPSAVKRLNLLGSLLHGSHPRAEYLHNGLDDDGLRLAEKLEKENEAPEVLRLLRHGNPNPVRRLADAMVLLNSDRQQGFQFRAALESTLMSDRPNGLAMKRRVIRTEAGRRRSVDLRSIVLTNAAVDFLVHRHLVKDTNGRSSQALSLLQLLGIMRERYGLYIDREPPGISISQELLRENRRHLERRLRDLGLLLGVNDAPSMKQLRPRFQVQQPALRELREAASAAAK
jgi:hypothetical protein